MEYVDFEKEVSKRLQENIREVRDSLDTEDIHNKIINYSNKYKLEPNYIHQLILDDINFASIFAKDPARQSIHENIVADYIKDLDVVKRAGSFKKLHSGGKNAKYATTHGVLKKKDGTKSIDFEIRIKEEVVYATCKYTKDEGGSQDNQYADVRSYVQNVLKMTSQNYKKENEHFIAIVDGGYYNRRNRKEELRRIGVGTVEILSVNEVREYLERLEKV